MRKNYLFLIVSAGLIVVDQLLKLLMIQVLPRNNTIPVIPGFLNFTYVENRGAAFSILEGHRWVLIVGVSIILAVLVYFMLSKRTTKISIMLLLSIVIAGGAGNLIDRMFRGYVVDYIDVSFRPLANFAVFNFADCLVVVGVILLFCWIIFGDMIEERKKKKLQTDSSDEQAGKES